MNGACLNMQQKYMHHHRVNRDKLESDFFCVLCLATFETVQGICRHYISWHAEADLRVIGLHPRIMEQVSSPSMMQTLLLNRTENPTWIV